MSINDFTSLEFKSRIITAEFILPSGEITEKDIEIRTSPVTGRTSRIAFSRINENEPGTGRLPGPPPDRDNISKCPFCMPQLNSQTPRIHSNITRSGRLIQGDSVLFPNLFPYGSYSAVSLFDRHHYVEIGNASVDSYFNSLINCRNYLKKILNHDPDAIYLAITQNHLPSAGGSLLHPHLQINADRIPSNHHRTLYKTADMYYRNTGHDLFSDYLAHEKEDGRRYIGRTGSWEWVVSFAPEGFFEIWGILPQKTSFKQASDTDWQTLASGIINIQKFYRHLNRNSYNLGLLITEDESSRIELRIVMLARSNYAPWVRSDYTGFEVMLGDMTTFIPPEQTAEMAREFF